MRSLLLLARVSACVAVDVTSIRPMLSGLFIPINKISAARLGLVLSLVSDLPGPFLVFDLERFYVPPIGIYSSIVEPHVFRELVAHVLVVHVLLIAAIRTVTAFFCLMPPCADRAEDINLLIA